MSHHCCKAGSVWGVSGVCQALLSLADSKLELGESPAPGCTSVTTAPVATWHSMSQRAFPADRGARFGHCWPNPGCQGECWVMWGLSQAPPHPRPGQSCGVSTALGMAALQRSNAGRAVTALLCHTQGAALLLSADGQTYYFN